MIKGKITESKKPVQSKRQLLVITGLSVAGKDTIANELLKALPKSRFLVSCTDRHPRKDEIPGVHYHFITPRELDRMHAEGELIETPVTYGLSRKATPKSEFNKILKSSGHVIWRIDTSLAAAVASGEFFEEKFPPSEAKVLKEISKVIFITASRKTLEARRKKRKKDERVQEDYDARDIHDRNILETKREVFQHVISNEDGKLSETITSVMEIIQSSH